MNKITKKKILLPAIIIIFVIAFVLLWILGIFGIAIDGMGYMFNHQKKYTVTTQNINTNIEFTLNLKDLSSNEGKIIYQDKDCNIEIDQVDKTDSGEYCIFLRSHGSYSYSQARLISGIAHHPNTFNSSASLKINIGGELYDCSIAGMSGINYKDGDQMGFYLSSGGYSPIDDNNEINEVTLILSDLIEYKIERN